ncbi:Dicarboxylate transport [Sphingopyxis sp. YR583]|uniref:YdbH domain-containing protein n=1 Tax=Sphingopyxis sp. YR583 TaxID=1881047 RepID=UPI0008A7CF98|nr:YdbH domain-containing protein [Sphingopyxis sp. YR583]SEH18535.1 Dicarboxylate transport [Sphingopyxis sp. YR583]
MTDAEAAPERRFKYRTLLFKKRWLTAGAVVILIAGVWIAREPIADEFIRDQFDSRGVPARYRIDRIGFRSEILSNIVIGDPKHPDLTAKRIEVLLGYGWRGPYVSGINADGVKLYGRFVNGRLSFGSLDKFRDPESKDPFALPDLSVVLRDARARVETPWGNIGAALNGGGNLRDDFAGRLALVAPTIAGAGCRGDDISFYGAVRVRSVRPQLVGPLRGRSLQCADGNVRAASPQIALDLSLSEDLQSWKGNVDASIAKLVAGPLSADRMGLLARFDGTALLTKIDADAEMARLRGADFTADAVKLEARGSVGSAAPTFDGEVSFARASSTADLRRSLAESARGLAGTPVGPLAAKAMAAFSRVLADASASAGFAIAGEGPTARIDLIAPELTSVSGARFAGSADSRIGYLYGADEPAVIATGNWSIEGGGLPSGTLRLDRSAEGRVTGLASLDAYSAEGARLALTPVRFSGGAGGLMRFATAATLSGPLAGGRVERLTVPLNGYLAPTGALAFDGGCSRVAAERIDVSGFRFGRSAIDLCSRPGAPLLSAGPEGVRGDIRIPGIALRGTSGRSPFSLKSGPADIDLSAMRWALALADIRLGEGESVTRFSAQNLNGRATAQGMAGDLRGASGKIGAVPLDMSEIAGQWRFADGALTLDGGLLLTDTAPDPRFFPLVSKDANLRFANGVIEAKAGFSERKTGTKILDTLIRHRLADSSGSADLSVKELRFNEAFQPDQLTSLALGVVANVRGSVVGDGRIEWTADGVTSRGTFATADASLAAAFGPVTGLTTTISFDDLIGLRTAPGQIAKIKEINPGIPVLDGEIEYRLLGDNQVRVEGGSWPFGGGKLLLHPTTLDFGTENARRLSFDIVGVDAAVFLQSFGFENINATGVFDGTLPVEFDGLGGRIVNGRIDSRGGGGTLAYVGELSNRNLGTIANFAFGALRSLKYDDLTIILNGDLDGEMVTDIRFGGVGQGEGATRNFLTNQVAKLPLIFNVKIRAPFRQLLTSAKGFYDPSLLIEQNLPALMRAQEEAEAAEKGAPSPVQPPESETMR